MESFPKKHRLRKRCQFLNVQKNGYKLVSRFFIGLILSNQDSFSRIGVTATRKYGNAVARNKIKRLVKEAFRKNLLSFPPGLDVVVIPKLKSKNFENALLFNDLIDLGKRITAYKEEKI